MDCAQEHSSLMREANRLTGNHVKQRCENNHSVLLDVVGALRLGATRSLPRGKGGGGATETRTLWLIVSALKETLETAPTL